MKFKHFLYLMPGALLVLFFMFGCSTTPIYEVDNDNFALINNEAWLYNSEVETSGEELDTSGSKAWGSFDISFNKSIFIMYKVAHIKSPTVDGNTLQATDVAIAGDGNLSYAYVTYAMAGDDFYGCTDILQLKKGYFPKIKSRLITKTEDINSVTYDSISNKLFLGLHVDPDAYGLDTSSGYHGAYLRSIELTSSKKVKVSDDNIVTQGVELQSYAANDAAILNDQVLVPVGAIGGGVERRDTDDISVNDGFISGINDTRAVATYDSDNDGSPDGFLVYQGPDQGWDDTNGEYIHSDPKLIKYDTNGNELAAFTFPSSITQDESKSTIEVHGNVAFVAASDGGVYAIDIDNMGSPEAELFNIPNPDPSLFGLTSDKVTANAVTVSTLEGSSDKSVIFIANGEYGVRAFELDFDIDGTTDVAAALASYDPSANELGYVHLGTGNSANSVLYRNGYLFVGTGRDGLNVFYVVDISFGIKPHWAKPSFK